MSQLQELLTKLQKQKSKIELLNIYKQVLNQTCIPDSDTDKHLKEVEQDVKNSIVLFIEKFIEKLETVESAAPTPIAPIINKVESKGPIPEPNFALDLSEKYSLIEKQHFGITHRHLAGKVVYVNDPSGENYSGEVVQLNCPYVIVKTSSGIKKVTLESISLGE